MAAAGTAGLGYRSLRIAPPTLPKGEHLAGAAARSLSCTVYLLKRGKGAA